MAPVCCWRFWVAHGLWGTCRWLSKRLPGFTQLICNTKHYWQPSCYQSPEELARATDAAAWLLTQLPVFRIDCMTGSKLHVAISLGATFQSVPSPARSSQVVCCCHVVHRHCTPRAHVLHQGCCCMAMLKCMSGVPFLCRHDPIAAALVCASGCLLM